MVIWGNMVAGGKGRKGREGGICTLRKLSWKIILIKITKLT